MSDIKASLSHVLNNRDLASCPEELSQWLSTSDPSDIHQQLNLHSNDLHCVQSNGNATPSSPVPSFFKRFFKFSPTSVYASPSHLALSVCQIGLSTITINSPSFSRTDIKIRCLNSHCNNLILTANPTQSTVRRSLPCSLTITATTNRPSCRLCSLVVVTSSTAPPLFIPIIIDSLPSFFGIWLKYLPSDPIYPQLPQPLAGLLRLFYESEGFKVSGVFRVAAAGNSIKHGRSLIQASGAVYEAHSVPSPLDHPHVVAGLIKQWFRELPDDLMQNPNSEVCEALGKCLRKVVENEEITKMSSHALSIVMGPNIHRQSINLIDKGPMESIGNSNNANTVFIKNLIENS
ncbi:hypothetical protein P9112_000963 [Eukaryota sp. TZLM1-RC]